MGGGKVSRPAKVYLNFYLVLVIVLLVVSGPALMPDLRFRLTSNESSG